VMLTLQLELGGGYGNGIMGNWSRPRYWGKGNGWGGVRQSEFEFCSTSAVVSLVWA